MIYNLIKIYLRKNNLYYFFIVLIAIIIPIIIYPRIYGVDAFQLMWMANALRDGALFSDNTWLISPFSYFGSYPFSHRAIGVPILLAFLISLLEFLSFGITEAILVYDLLLIILIYKCSRNLGKRLFEEEWSRIVFVSAILLSPNVIYDTTMTVSSRLIITIIMIVLLDLNLKLVSHNDSNRFKTILTLGVVLLIGALAHRLWMGTVITIIFMIYTIIVRRYKKLQRFTLFLILPLSVIAFFYGLGFFYVDPQKIVSPFFDNSTLFGVSINLSIHYALQSGIILLFFPIGVTISLYKLITLLKKHDIEKKSIRNQQFIREFYLQLFIIPFAFMIPVFYAVVIFLPIIIIFSVYGLVYIKKIIANISKKFDYVFSIVIFIFSMGYSFLYVQMILRINLWYIFALFSIILFTYLIIFIIHIYDGKIKSKISFININNYKFLQGLEVIVLILSIIIFSTTTNMGRWHTVDSSPYPWENRYLTEEEQQIISFFQNEDITGFIFTSFPEIAERISGVGFLPIFSDRTVIGIALYYRFITPNEIHKNTIFSLSEISTLRFFTFDEVDPIRSIRDIIIRLNVSLNEDKNLLKFEYNIQYIITGVIEVLTTEASWTLLQSLPTKFVPIFSTQHLLVWKMY